MRARKPVRIAVLSDQHIDREHAPESWQLAKHAFKMAAALDVDHVVLCGDTFDCATAMLDDKTAVSVDGEIREIEHTLTRVASWLDNGETVDAALFARQLRPASTDAQVPVDGPPVAGVNRVVDIARGLDVDADELTLGRLSTEAFPDIHRDNPRAAAMRVERELGKQYGVKNLKRWRREGKL